MRSTEAPPGWIMGKAVESGGIMFHQDQESPPFKNMYPPKLPPKDTFGNGEVIPWEDIQQEAVACLTEQRLQFAVESLRVSREALKDIGIGWNPQSHAYTFPMMDISAGCISGIRTRTPNGAKFAITGSKQGCFTSSTYELVGAADLEPIFICEGPTDTAAMLGMDLYAIGRACCTHIPAGLVHFVGSHEVVIVADRDVVGMRGAAALKSKFAYNAKVIIPPPKYKDARDWITNGKPSREEILNKEAHKIVQKK